MNRLNLDKRLVTILLIVFVQMVGASMVLPILPLYAQGQFEMSSTAVTLLVASFFAAQFIGGPILGRWSDRIGRVPVLIVSQIGTVIAFIAFGLATTPWMLFASRIFDGLTGGNIVVAQAYVTDVTPREKRAQALGLIAAMFGLAFIIGPIIGGLLVGFGPRVPYFIAAGAAALVVILTRLTLDESMTAEQREEIQTNAVKLSMKAALAIRPLVYVLLIAFTVQFALGIVISTLALFGEAVLFDSNPELGVGMILAFVGASQLATQTAILPRALKRISEERLVVIGIAIRSAALLIYSFMVSPALAIIGGIFFSMGGGLTIPPSQSIATKTVDDSKRGGVLGAFQAVTSLAVIFSTAIAGVLFAIDPHLPNRVGFVACILSLVPAVALGRALSRRVRVDT